MTSSSNEHFSLWESTIQKIKGFIYIENEEIGYSNFEIIDQSINQWVQMV
jgi:hypothetical protein